MNTNIFSKSVLNNVLRFIVFVYTLLFVLPFVRANDYLELERHYSVMTTGQDVIHFKIPVWAYGRAFDYYISSSSYAYLQVMNNGSAGSVQKIAEFNSDRYDENENKDNTKGTAYLKMLIGDAVVTSMYNGVNQLVGQGMTSGKLIVKQTEHDDCPQVTFLEFDWYPPHSLTGQTFRIGMHLYISKSYTGNVNYEKDFSGFGDNFRSNDNIMDPQLYNPYLYTLNEEGVAGYGYAAVPFVTFQETYSYKTSFEPNKKWRNTSRSGNIYVPTTDTVREQIFVDFDVLRNATTHDTITVRTNKVDIPPYHRIYDFSASAEMDSTGTYTGASTLQWTVKNPTIKDIMEGDFYEIQRALNNDYSDARSVGIVAMKRSYAPEKKYDGDTVTFKGVPNTYTYSYTDNSRETWTGNADVSADTIARHITHTATNVPLHDPNGNLTYSVDVTLTSEKAVLPAVPVYYRIRRASASGWGWNNELAQTAMLYNKNFLAPLAEEPISYTLDDDFDNNRKVHFSFHLDNAEVSEMLPGKDLFKMDYKINSVLKDSVDIAFVSPWYMSMDLYLTILSHEGDSLIKKQLVTVDGEYRMRMPAGTTLVVGYMAHKDYYEYWAYKHYYEFEKIALDQDYKLQLDFYQGMGGIYSAYKCEKFPLYSELPGLQDDVRQHLFDSIYNVLSATYHGQTYGRCMWDRTANLVLRRTIPETGLTQEYVIPQDSIRRQPDGSWIATYSDVADLACSHYNYGVRIDQSHSDLHVKDSAQLALKPITGPELYFDEAADITSFNASKGDATTALKNGVLLQWQVNTNAVDEFVLTRIELNSDQAPDTLYRGVAYDFMDRTAVPNKHYEYTITTSYSCNGRTTDHSATAEGWRTPYGEISGSVLMADNSGMAGVTVALQDSAGNVVRTMLTDATGAYKFDSLIYVDGIMQCEDPQVIIEYSGIERELLTEARTSPEQYTYVRITNPDGVVINDWHNLAQGTYTFDYGTVLEIKNSEIDNTNRNEIYSFTITQNMTIECKNAWSSTSTIVGGLSFKPVFRVNTNNITDVTCHQLGSHLYANCVVMPTSQYGSFSFNNTSSGTATVSLSAANAVAGGIDFVNTSSTRLTGRVLYKMSTIPVAGAMFLLNGDTVRRGTVPLTTGPDGNFNLVLPLNQPCRLQVFKPGHTFEGDGILRVEGGEVVFALTKPLDQVRFYDTTKVRLVGRVAGGNDQRDLPEGFGIGVNNLGDGLQLVLQLEGDNTAQIVHDPDDITKDTIHQTIEHIVHSTDPLSAATERVVGVTHATFEKKRIIIKPDSLTGEYQIDLFPVKYKVVQATANGYATLFASGQGSETFDLTNAPLVEYTAKYHHDTREIIVSQEQVPHRTYQLSNSSQQTRVYNGDSIAYNAVYDRIYHAPVSVKLTQVLYGIEHDGFGEKEMEVSSFDMSNSQKVRLYEMQQDGSVNYLLGYPVFIGGRKYQFTARAYERYYYNNDPHSGRVDDVPQRGGSVTIRNGLHSNTESTTYVLDQTGRCKSVSLMVDQIDTENSGNKTLRSVSAVLQYEGNYVETTAFQAFVAGTDIQQGELMQTESEVVLHDIIRDPGGNGSSAWVEAGTTYKFGYKESYDWTIGAQLNFNWGVNISQDIGVVAAPLGSGSYTGSTFESSRLLTVPLPVSHEFKWGYQYNYSVTTTERISTSSGHTIHDVGSMNDVFVGSTISQLAGKAKTVSIITDSLYQARQPAFNAGLMKKLAQGTTTDGKTYYLVTGLKTVLGSHIGGSFAYSQSYVLNTLIPRLAMERQNLLMNFPDSIAAQTYANTTGEAVYWNINSAERISATDSIPKTNYIMLVPDNGKLFTNRVAALDNMIAEWVSILNGNENEKVNARISGRGTSVGTWSVSNGTTVSHSDTYSATVAYNELPQSPSLGLQTAQRTGADFSQQLLSNAVNIFKFFKNSKDEKIGTTVANAIAGMQNDQGVQDGTNQQQQQTMGTVSNTSKFTFDYKPIFDYSSDFDLSQGRDMKKSAGFTIGADNHGDITVAVYRANLDSVWKSESALIRDNVQQGSDDDLLYGSYVFYTIAGSSYCPHEAEEKTLFYNPGTVLNNATQWVHKPQLSIDTYEQTAVMPDQKAVFRVTIMDNSEVLAGTASTGIMFDLSLVGTSNPDGAKIWMDGAPLIATIPIYLLPGQAVTKVMEVERGVVDDYNDLQLMLSLTDCPKTYTTLNFSVHYLPESSPVNITMPRQNWIMNTLSQHDSIGYYMPVEINGFNVHQKGFDHIEFQYKLTTQSEDDWVNQCSFYANDSLYSLATGNKAMIQNGRIVPFRFYGEKDPIEQRYDLRAVAFCRFGSGYVTKASTVVSGVKDTRPPRVFGEPEPVNAILGVGEHLKLRFNEPIAGNYLDQDNNFQLMGVTNQTGLTTHASLHFDGTPQSYATTQVSRTLEAKSYTLDMIVKPANNSEAMLFFEHGSDGKGVSFGITDDNRLQLSFGNTTIKSKPLPYEMIDFTRVAVVYDYEDNIIRFYSGTLDVTDPEALPYPDVPYTVTAPLVFGRGFNGNMLEVRLWTKALTQEEIVATDKKYLTGYEQELVAYYKMNEGIGNSIKDFASGATLTINNASWNLPKGISLSIPQDKRVALAKNLMSRSSVYDATYMFWFKNNSASGTIFSASDKRFSINNGKLNWWLNDTTTHSLGTIDTNQWHHLVLAINRTYNNVAIYLDGNLADTYPATLMTGITGDMYLGGDGFEGNVDELAIFEQALPKALIEEYGRRTPMGDEMGLMAYLPFEEQKQNPNRVIELVFSSNDRRIFKDPNGDVLDKEVPLIVGVEQLTSQGNYQPIAEEPLNLSDKVNYAPVQGFGLLSKLNFDWAFNSDELLINLNMHDREINKQTLYVTVRDVEDLNGNPMPSPVTWVAYADRNSLKWDTRQINFEYIDYEHFDEEPYMDISFSNLSGRRHQYRIESVPQWLEISEAVGSIEPMGYKEVKMTFKTSLPIGNYSDMLYLTDENGLSEPLRVEYKITASCPWEQPNKNAYTMNMSVCAQVMIDNNYDTDNADKVVALYRNECVGMANVNFDNVANRSEVFLTVYGNETMVGKDISFELWRASTGKMLKLTPDRQVTFAHGFVFGCGNQEPVMMRTEGNESQNISLNAGWTWISFNLDINPENATLNNHMSASIPWQQGDMFKNPATRQFSSYSAVNEQFDGTLPGFDYKQMYMAYSKSDNTLRISGNQLKAEDKYIIIKGGGQWNVFPCLFNMTTAITEALAAYYDYATPGDIIKSHDNFATFSRDNKWVGDLKALRPGEGYLFRRLGTSDVKVQFYDQISTSARRNVRGADFGLTQEPAYTNPLAANNMTMIAKMEDDRHGWQQKSEHNQTIYAYVGEQLAAVAQPYNHDNETLYFITIQSDISDTVRFETADGRQLVALTSQGTAQSRCEIINVANQHLGSLQAPVILAPSYYNTTNTAEETTLRLYSATGQLIAHTNDPAITASREAMQTYLDNIIAPLGIYNAVVNINGKVTTHKLLKGL